MGMLVTVLGPRRRLRLARVGMQMMRVVMRMLMRVSKRAVLMAVGMVRHTDLLPIKIQGAQSPFVPHEALFHNA